ncbi:uncharacterized protein LOC132755242 [Ruditapes philippinarum]|uniref:uncharacterized protein LOC132755242 n=1 Tax=Ruditapes philippinarum TaxID=129788 RepID=UPI00295AC4FA|nr:uncharacterized protein LOC132755242 [Ruditapes philippinarum]
MDSRKICLLAFFAVAARAVPELHSFESHYGGKIIAVEDAVFDKQGQYALIKINSLSDKIVSTLNLHDFNTNFTAVRNNEMRRCHIFRTRHTLSEMMDLYKTAINRKGFHDVTQTFTCTSKAIVPAQEMFHFGNRIAEFCTGDEVMFSERKFLTKRKRSISAIREASISCGLCIGGCNHQ